MTDLQKIQAIRRLKDNAIKMYRYETALKLRTMERQLLIVMRTPRVSMNIFFLILLPFFSIAQATTYNPGDSTWLVSWDTSKVKVYKLTQRMLVDPGAGGGVHFDDAQVIAYGYSDTIKPRLPYGSDRYWDSVKHSPNPKDTPVFREHGIKIELGLITDSTYHLPLGSHLEQTLAISYFDDSAPTTTKYDTIGPTWHQVSDLTPGYNPLMAMQLYEVRVYEKTRDIQGVDSMGNLIYVLAPHHFAWLDLKKKSFNLAVWEATTVGIAPKKEPSIDEMVKAGWFNGCPVPNPTFKHKKKK